MFFPEVASFAEIRKTVILLILALIILAGPLNNTGPDPHILGPYYQGTGTHPTTLGTPLLHAPHCRPQLLATCARCISGVDWAMRLEKEPFTRQGWTLQTKPDGY